MAKAVKKKTGARPPLGRRYLAVLSDQEHLPLDAIPDKLMRRTQEQAS
jgi:hypothetical protein